MFMRSTKIMLPLAIVCIATSNLLGRIGTGVSPAGNFFEGLTLGLGFTLGVFVLVKNIVAGRDG